MLQTFAFLSSSWLHHACYGIKNLNAQLCMMMTLDDFKDSLRGLYPPSGSSELLQALWHDANDDWGTAHDTAQEVHSKDGSWVHAYLHRREGDISNAKYWYSKAGKNFPAMSLEEEWDIIVTDLLKKNIKP